MAWVWAKARDGIRGTKLVGYGEGNYFHYFLPVIVASFVALRPTSATPVALINGFCKILGGKELLPLNTYPFWGFRYLFSDPS